MRPRSGLGNDTGGDEREGLGALAGQLQTGLVIALRLLEQRSLHFRDDLLDLRLGQGQRRPAARR